MLIMTGLMAAAIGAVIVLGRLVMDESKAPPPLRHPARRDSRQPVNRDVTARFLLVGLLLGMVALLWSISTWLQMMMALALRDQQLLWIGRGLLVILLFSGLAIWLGNRLEQRGQTASRFAARGESRSVTTSRDSRSSSMHSTPRR